MFDRSIEQTALDLLTAVNDGDHHEEKKGQSNIHQSKVIKHLTYFTHLDLLWGINSHTHIYTFHDLKGVRTSELIHNIIYIYAADGCGGDDGGGGAPASRRREPAAAAEAGGAHQQLWRPLPPARPGAAAAHQASAAGM